MAKATLELIAALRRTANRIEKGAPYQWGHMGSCNCGNLAQELTQFSKAEIHAFAMEGRGDWNEQVAEFCPTSGLPMDMLIAEMLNKGLTTTDLQHLERLSDKKVLARIWKPVAKSNACGKNWQGYCARNIKAFLRGKRCLFLGTQRVRKRWITSN